MDGWLISQGRKTSKRLIYKLLKSDLSVHKSANTYDKTKVTGDMKKIQEASTYFRQIVFPEPSDDYYLRMDCFEKLGDQHRGLFLAGFLGFHRHGDKKSMKRLMAIWEILKMKGEQLPKMCDFDGIPSNEVYSYVNKWSKMIYDVNNFEKPILLATATSILDKIAKEVKLKCDKTWSTSHANWLGQDIADIVKHKETNQNRSKMILTRIEISKKGTSKTWKTSVEVEHIAPKSYQKDWIDKSKGGGFIDKDDYKKVYIENIGNRTLLDPGSNKPLTNFGFHAKQKLAKHGYNQQSSSWYVTKGLEDTAISVWGPIQIEKRAEKLIKELVSLYDDAFIGL
ncbi:HNH endonuclease family protein [Euryarchaeota archaeon]|nr:HNH endonuclease family protein [Euryarchaeota archaeon]